jgi:hypothetical protein
VYPHIGDLTNLAGYPPLKPNIILRDYLLDHNLSLRMNHQFKEDRKMVPTLKNSSISPRKNISGTYLICRLFARGRATSKHGGGGRYDAILEFRGEQIKNFMRKKKRKNEKKKERKKEIYEKNKKNMSMCKNKNKVNSRVL